MSSYRLCLVGFGNIARRLVEIFINREQFLSDKHGVSFKVTAISDLEGAVIAPPGEEISFALLDRLIRGNDPISKLPGFRVGFGALDTIASADADIMIELTPTRPKDGQPALDHILKAFDQGMHVVTANKGPLVVSYQKVIDASLKAGRMFKFGCATAAALPSTNVGYYDLAGCDIENISGILNGTSNYILTCMHDEGLSFEAALARAQEMGIAETDPSLDVNGTDTAIKLVILANALLDANLTLSDVKVDGIRGITSDMIKAAKADGKAYKLIGRALRDVEQRVLVHVAPQLVPQSDPFYQVEGTAKAISFSTDLMGTLMVSGGASHPVAAAAAILRDLINLSREE
jgi:homoserine dehydrogenase